MIYPNTTGASRVPLGIVYLLTILRKQGHSVKLFDMTFYGVNVNNNYVDVRSKNLNFKGINLTPYGVIYKKSSFEEVKRDLIEDIEQFEPDLIGVTISEETSPTGFLLANVIKKKYPKTKIVFGGVFCIANPEGVISHPAVDIVCIAEGEVALPKLLQKLENGENITDIQGLWIKKNDKTIVKNIVAPLISLDELPFLDLSFIDDRHFYATIAGHVYRMTYFGTQRGCPRRCAYCSNQIFLNVYKKNVKGYIGRKMSIPRVIDNLVHLKKNYDMNFFQIIDDDFMLRSLNDIKQFSRLYKEKVSLPFWIQAEANNVTEEKVSLLKDAGLIAVAMGIETGNEYVRKKVFNRNTTKEESIHAFRIMHKYGIRTSGNVIIGVPHEGRKEIFDTINLVRKCQPKSLGVNVYVPYFGTKLREYCIEKGYMSKGYIHDGRTPPLKLVLNMPQISAEEIDGFVRTFPLYADLPKKYWQTIKQCEVLTEESEKIFDSLEKIYWELAEAKGMNYDVPGFDYDAFFLKRQKELEDRESKKTVSSPS
ncbi:MAG: B12-binding domain-containing radical SAM protein [Candidatus Bathyarchaeota archaeon]|nr:B12-binding domain-containing radical SAM protein [Candidatus Bathyarchaeota archaeon]